METLLLYQNHNHYKKVTNQNNNTQIHAHIKATSKVHGKILKFYFSIHEIWKNNHLKNIYMLLKIPCFLKIICQIFTKKKTFLGKFSPHFNTLFSCGAIFFLLINTKFCLGCYIRIFFLKEEKKTIFKR
jgi:hypothetical protein